MGSEVPQVVVSDSSNGCALRRCSAQSMQVFGHPVHAIGPVIGRVQPQFCSRLAQTRQERPDSPVAYVIATNSVDTLTHNRTLTGQDEECRVDPVLPLDLAHVAHQPVGALVATRSEPESVVHPSASQGGLPPQACMSGCSKLGQGSRPRHLLSVIDVVAERDRKPRLPRPRRHTHERGPLQRAGFHEEIAESIHHLVQDRHLTQSTARNERRGLLEPPVLVYGS